MIPRSPNHPGEIRGPSWPTAWTGAYAPRSRQLASSATTPPRASRRACSSPARSGATSNRPAAEARSSARVRAVSTSSPSLRTGRDWSKIAVQRRRFSGVAALVGTVPPSPSPRCPVNGGRSGALRRVRSPPVPPQPRCSGEGVLRDRPRQGRPVSIARAISRPTKSAASGRSPSKESCTRRCNRKLPSAPVTSTTARIFNAAPAGPGAAWRFSRHHAPTRRI